MPTVPDSLTEAGAKALAHKIERYWRAQGFEKIAVAIVPVSMRKRNDVEHTFVVRSNIGPTGFPPS